MDYARLEVNDDIKVILPLTRVTGKARVKERNSFYEYGNPVAVRQASISLKHYVEWQIGYDATVDDVEKGKKITTLTNYTFKGSNGKMKHPFELSEILYYSVKNNYVSINDIRNIFEEIKNVNDTLDILPSMQIMRTNPIEVVINDIDFYKMQVSYPLIVHKFGKYDIYAEIINKEKQRAVGVQPMLFVCLPITSLEFDVPPLGRALNANECANWVIGKEEAKLSLELFRIFGMLTENHKFDVLEILKTIFSL